MIKTLKQTISNIYYWIKKKLIQFKKWLVILIFGSAVLAAPLALPADTALINVQKDYHASELKDKYRLEKTAFILDAVDENAIQAEVGNKSLDSFEPSLMLRKWDDEVNFRVKYKKPEIGLLGGFEKLIKKDRVDLEGNKIKFKSDKTEVHFYEMKKGEVLLGKELKNDVYEVEVLLLEKPDTNIVEFDIETKGLAFYYQPELTQEEKDEGAFRPENVIGSYAVYHESKQGDYSKMGLKNYRAGKAFHIYRPKIIDSAGTEVWGALNITDNLLTVEIPQEFLDNAVYPVRHAAGLTFGYEIKGGTSGLMSKNWIHAVKFIGAVGTGTSITMWLKEGNAGGKIKFALYGNYSGDDPVDLIAYTAEWTITSGYDAEKTLDFTSSPELTAVNYGITSWGGVQSIFSYYDDGDANQRAYRSLAYTTLFPDPFGTPSYSTKKYTRYCTYTAGGGAERRMFLTQ